MRIRLQSILLLLILSLHGFGQEKKGPGNLSYKAGYFGEFVMHPGFYTGVDYVVKRKKWMDIHLDAELASYFHRRNNNAYIIQLLMGTRFINLKGLYIDASVGMGYMLSSPSGDFYKVNRQGDLVRTGRPYSSHAKPTMLLELGWNGYRNGDIPYSLGIGIEGYGQTHFNHMTLPHLGLRFGGTIQLCHVKI